MDHELKVALMMVINAQSVMLQKQSAVIDKLIVLASQMVEAKRIPEAR